MKKIGKQTLFLTSISRVIAALGGLLFTVIISQKLGSAVVGAFTFSSSCTLLLVMVARMGGDRGLVKFSSIHTGPEWSKARMHQMRRCYAVSVFLSLLIILGVLLFIGTSSPPSPRLQAFTALALAIPFVSLMWLNAGFIKGMFKPHVGSLFENGGLFALSGLMFLIIGWLGYTLDMVTLVISFVLAGIVAWLLSLWCVFFFNRRSKRNDVQRSINYKNTKHGNFQFALIDITNFLMAAGSFIVGGLILSDFDLGLLRGAERGTLLVGFVLSITNAIVAPRIARSFANGDHADLLLIGQWAVKWNALLALPLFLICILYPEIFTWLFGRDFEGIEKFIRIMVIGQIVNVLSGPCGMFLSMTAYAGIVLKINFFTMLASMTFYVVFCHLFGPTGFAIAYTLSIILKNGTMLLALKQKLNLWYLPILGYRDK